MRIHIVSDLHLNHIHRGPGSRFSSLFPNTGIASPEETGADVLVLAGDIAGDCEAVGYFKDYKIPVVMIVGNHESYGHVHHDVIDRNKNESKGTAVHFLENESIVINGVRFIGSTLWTDCKIGHGSDEAKKDAVRYGLNDFRVIKTRQNDGSVKTLSIDESIAWHNESIKFIKGELDTDHNGSTVVVTHHLPSEACVSEKYKGSPINGGFASNLDSLINGDRVNLWIHGHTHDCVDTVVNGTRIFCNPRGYPMSLRSPGPVSCFNDVVFENEFFNPAAVVEV